MRAGIALMIALAAAPLAAQVCDGPVTVEPANPTNNTAVTLSFLGFAPLCSSIAYRIEGNVITVEHEWECVITFLQTPRRLTIGRLPPGHYEVRVVHGNEFTPPLACGTFTVTAAASAEDIPALTPASLIALALALIVISLIAFRHAA